MGNNTLINIKSLINILLFKKKNNQLHVEFFRYFVSSGISLIFDYLTYFLLTRIFRTNYIISNIIGNTVGMIVNYILNILWVFEKRKIKNKIVEFILFAITFFLGTAIHTFVFWIFKDLLLIYDIISRVIATIISYFFRFITRKIFLFK